MIISHFRCQSCSHYVITSSTKDDLNPRHLILFLRKVNQKKTQHTVLRNLLHLDSTFHSTCYLVPIKYEALYQLVLSFPKTEKISTNKFSNKFLLPRVRTDIFFIIVITFSELKTAAEGKS